jgi:hypothetical protein
LAATDNGRSVADNGRSAADNGRSVADNGRSAAGFNFLSHRYYHAVIHGHDNAVIPIITFAIAPLANSAMRCVLRGPSKEFHALLSLEIQYPDMIAENEFDTWVGPRDCPVGGQLHAHNSSSTSSRISSPIYIVQKVAPGHSLEIRYETLS